jgi:hypothetical protein
METTLEKETISRKEACEILKIKNHTLTSLIKNKIILLYNNRDLDLSSVMEYKKELEERRNVTSPKWINHGGYGSL